MELIKGDKDLQFKNMKEDSNPFITPKNSLKSKNTEINVSELANKKAVKNFSSS
jgi:hypothetical protein